ncbi:MAG: zinc ribbon domain-containing protein [Bacteroides sp.]
MICPKCGAEFSDNFKFCGNCAAPLTDDRIPPISPPATPTVSPTVSTAKKKSNAGFIIGVTLVAVLGIIFAIIMIGVTGSVANGVKPNKKPAVAEVEPKEAYIASCQTLDYTEISRNPSLYAGQRVLFSGKVVQVAESSGNIVLRVDTSEDEYGLWEGTIYVTYEKPNDDESRILEDDIISLYGEFKGIKSYTAILGNEITVPEIKAKYVELSVTAQ